MNKLKSFTALAAIAALVAVSIPTDAWAGHRGHHGYHGYKHGYHGGYHRGYRHGYRHGGGYYKRGHSHAWVPFAIFGAGLVGYAIADSKYRTTTTTTTTHVPAAAAPPPSASSTAGYSASRPCNVVYRDEDQGGQTIRLAATMCYDASGNSYIVQGSEHQIPIE